MKPLHHSTKPLLASVRLITLWLVCCSLLTLARPVDAEVAQALARPMMINARAMILDDERVVNAPLTARATTTAVRELADGNTITNIETTKIYRASDGRIRRELGSEAARTVLVTDPGRNAQIDGVMMGLEGVIEGLADLPHELLTQLDLDLDVTQEPGEDPSGVVILRQDGTETTMNFTDAAPAQWAAEIREQLQNIGPKIRNSLADVEFLESEILSELTGLGHGNTTTEALGADSIDGLRVEGTLQRTVIPAGEIGNRDDIVVQKTSWFSPELRLMMRSVEKDPRFGTVTYELEVLDRTEPDAALFD